MGDEERPEVRAALADGSLSASAATELARLPVEEQPRWVARAKRRGVRALKTDLDFQLMTPEEREQVRLEGWSRNTFENAISAKSFVMMNGYRSVILVTSDYHVPRALRAFLTVLPADVTVSVLPVRSVGRWGMATPRTVRLFFVEGWKYWWYRVFLLWE